MIVMKENNILNMKKIFLALLPAIFLFISCGSGSTSDPVGITKAFMKAVEGFDFKTARTLVTPDYIPSIENMEKFAAGMTDEQKNEKTKKASSYQFDYKLAEKTDSAATVTVNGQGERMSVNITFFLKNQNGKWLIDAQKDEF